MGPSTDTLARGSPSRPPKGPLPHDIYYGLEALSSSRGSSPSPIILPVTLVIPYTYMHSVLSPVSFSSPFTVTRADENSCARVINC